MSRRERMTAASSAPWVLAFAAGGAAAGVAVGAVTAGGWALPGLAGIAGWALLAALFALVAREPSRGVWALLLVTPLMDYGRIVSEPFPVTLFQAVLAATIAGTGWRLLAGESKPHRPNPMQLALGAPFLAALWSLPLSLDPGRTAVGAARLLFLWLFALLVSYHAEDSRRRERMLAVFVAVGVALTAVSFVQYAFPWLPLGNVHMQFAPDGVELLTRPAAFYLDPNFLAGYLSVAALVSLVALAHSSGRRQAALWAVPAVVCGMGTAMTLSRSGMVGLVAGAVVVVLTAPPRRRRVLVTAAIVAAVLAGPFVPDRYVRRVTAITNVWSEGSLATRYLMFGSTVEVIGDYWGTGTGLAAYDVAYPAYRRVGALPRILRPHEVPLAMAAEMGVAGLLAEIGLLAGLAWAFLRARRRGWRTSDSMILAGLVALLVQSWFQYYLYFEYLWLFAALAAALPARPHDDGAVDA